MNTDIVDRTQPLDFSDKLVVITGGASGLGFEVATQFSAQGAKLHLVGRSEDKLLRAVDSLRFESEQSIHYSVGDVSDSTFVEQSFLEARQVHQSSVSILINSAGVIHRASAEQTSDEDWQRVMNTNVNGVFYCSREFAKYAQDPGVIVNVSSTCGQVGAAGLAAYCASKGAVDQLTRSMALELAEKGICVNAVAPGAINSPMLFSKHPDGAAVESVVDRNNESIPQGRIAEPQEVARSILFLARERHITGAILSVDGGYTSQ